MGHRGGYVVLANYDSTSSNKVYEVRRGGDGILYCQCRGWVSSKSRPYRMCTHTKDYVRNNPGTVYDMNEAVLAAANQKRRADAEKAAAARTAQLAAERERATKRGVSTPAAALNEYLTEVSRFSFLDSGEDGASGKISAPTTKRILDLED